MQVRFWGVRGSYPVPGPATNRFGGNTPCVELRPVDGSTIIIDAGTGIRRLGQQLARGEFGAGQGSCHLLISHTHWDHIQGLPFFAPLYFAGNEINIYGRQRDVQLQALFGRQSQAPYFPVTLEDARARLTYNELLEGAELHIGECRVSCTALNHPYSALGYRIEHEQQVVAYVSDTAPFDEMVLGYQFIGQRPAKHSSLTEADRSKLAAMEQGVLALCADVDLLIYDTMFTMEEYRACPHWGHSAAEHAIAIAEQAGARALALFHHHPNRTDQQQQNIVEQVQQQTQLPVIGAAEEMSVRIAAGQAKVEQCA